MNCSNLSYLVTIIKTIKFISMVLLQFLVHNCPRKFSLNFLFISNNFSFSNYFINFFEVWKFSSLLNCSNLCNNVTIIVLFKENLTNWNKSYFTFPRVFECQIQTIITNSRIWVKPYFSSLIPAGSPHRLKTKNLICCNIIYCLWKKALNKIVSF